MKENTVATQSQYTKKLRAHTLKKQSVNSIKQISKTNLHNNKLNITKIKKEILKNNYIDPQNTLKCKDSSDSSEEIISSSASDISSSPSTNLKSKTKIRQQKNKKDSKKQNNKTLKVPSETITKKYKKSKALGTLSPISPMINKKLLNTKKSNEINIKRKTKKPFSPSNSDNIQSNCGDSTNLSFSLDYVSPSDNENIIVHSSSFHSENGLTRKNSITKLKKSISFNDKYLLSNSSFNKDSNYSSSENIFIDSYSSNAKPIIYQSNITNEDDLKDIGTDINKFKDYFMKFENLTSKANLVFTKTYRKDISSEENEFSNSGKNNPLMFTLTPAHTPVPRNSSEEMSATDITIDSNDSLTMMSSDTGLANSMESFQLLSSDPVGPEDNVWLLPSTSSNQYNLFNNSQQNFTCPNTPNIFLDYQKSKNNNSSSEEDDENVHFDNNKEKFLVGSSNIFLDYEKSKAKKEKENKMDFTFGSSNIFLEYERSKAKKEKENKIDFGVGSSNIFLEYEKSKNKPRLHKSDSTILTECTNNLNLNSDDSSSFYTIDKGESGVYIVGGHEEMCLGLGKHISEVSHFTFLNTLKNIKFIATGETSCFAVEAIEDKNNMDKNYVWSFGNNMNNVLGYSDKIYQPKKIEFFNQIKINQIVSSKDITIFRSEDGKLYISGKYTDINGNLQTNSVPEELSTFKETIIDVAISKGYVYAISNKNDLYCWNYNSNLYYERTLYYNDENKYINAIKIPIKNQNDEEMKFINVFSGKYHSFLIDTNHHVLAFGANQWGQLGLNDDQDVEYPELVKDLIDIPIVQISCGNFHTLFRSETGFVYACGKNDRSQLGLNSKSGSIWKPEKLNEIQSCVYISCGADHSAAIIDNSMDICEIDHESSIFDDPNHDIFDTSSVDGNYLLNPLNHESNNKSFCASPSPSPILKSSPSFSTATELINIFPQHDDEINKKLSIHNNNNDNNNNNNNNNNQRVLYTWGSGESYNLGTGSNISKNSPKQIKLKIFKEFKSNYSARPKNVQMNVVQVEAGKGFTLMLSE